jgi:hypothetical protein
MVDRTTKLLLSLITLALWALLLRPAFTPVPSHAQQPLDISLAPSARFERPVVTILPTTGHLSIVDNSGWIYLLDPNSLDIKRSVRLMPKR